MKTISKFILIGNVIVLAILLLGGTILYLSPSKTDENVIHGQILEMETKIPLSNCRVTLEYIDDLQQTIESRVTRTDGNGYYSFDDIKDKDDLGEDADQIRISSWDDLHFKGTALMNFESHDQEVLIYLRPGGRISGSIRDFNDLDGVTFVCCYKYGSEQDPFPLDLNSVGTFQSELIYPGTYHLFLCSDQFIPTKPVAVEVTPLVTSTRNLNHDSSEADVIVNLNISGDFHYDPYIVISSSDVAVACFEVTGTNMTIALPSPGNYSVRSEGGNSDGSFVDYYEFTFNREVNFADIKLEFVVFP